MKPNKWRGPHEWLEDYLQELTRLEADEAINRLYSEAIELAAKLDADAIQDAYQSDMDDYGYFD